jgi:hypothetical protein
MGYHMDMWVDETIRIPREFLPKLAKKMQGFYKKQYKRSGNSQPLELVKGQEAEFVQELLGREASLSSTLDLNFLEITQWDGDKLGDWLHDALKLITPFVMDGGVLECEGEDRERWKWEFRQGQMMEFYPVTLWENQQVYRLVEVS